MQRSLLFCLLLLTFGLAKVQDEPVEDLIGRLLILGFQGQDVPLDRLEIFQPAGFVFYASNIASIEAVRELTQTLRDAAPYPLLLATNLEGGVVNGYQTPDATAWPSLMAIAATGEPDYARQIAQAAGEELAYAGFNVSFGPVVDVNVTLDNPIIGIRSFGSDARVVSSFATAYLQGLEQAGIMAVAKHFPGHGDTLLDSHLDLPVVAADKARLEQVELAPYHKLIEAKLPAIMTAHVVFPALDEANPATLSQNILTDLLRDELNFTGIVMTDSMGMKAITDRYHAGEAAILSILAGADLVLLPTELETQQEVYAALQEAVARGRLSEARVREAVGRSSAAASHYHPKGAPVPDYPAHRDLALEIATKAVTLLWNDAVLPLEPESTVAVIAPAIKTLGSISNLTEVFSQHHAKTLKAVIGEKPSAEEVESALHIAAQAEVIILASYHWSEPLAPSLIDLEAELIKTGKPVVVVALGNPDDLRFLERPMAYLATYGPRDSSLEAASLILTGQVIPGGKLPMPMGDFVLGSGLTGF